MGLGVHIYLKFFRGLTDFVFSPGKINLFGVDTGRKESSMDTRGKFTLSLAYVSSREIDRKRIVRFSGLNTQT